MVTQMIKSTPNGTTIPVAKYEVIPGPPRKLGSSLLVTKTPHRTLARLSVDALALIPKYP